jgi:outer membrane protein assembly factor BamB
MNWRSLFSIVLASIASTLSAANWPAWRGPEGTGVCTEKELPLHWSAADGVKWRIPLPERGNSTPIVWDKRVFITQAIEQTGRRELICFDRADGRLLWRQGVTFPGKELTHATNPQCSASPATDGERVIASFGSAGLYCYDLDGKEIWHRDLGKQTHIWGGGASPVIHGDLCLLNFGPGPSTFLVALNKRTGKTLWQHDEPGGHSGEKKPGEQGNQWIGSWSTPIAIQTGGREELVMSWPNRVMAFEPKSGRELWSCGGLTPLVYTSPLYGDGVVVAMSGFGGSALAIRTGGAGDITATHRLWQHPRNPQRIGSGVISGAHAYIVNESGVGQCIDLKSGEDKWAAQKPRLAGQKGTSATWGSMLLAGDRLYLMNKNSDTFIIRASPKFELLATNSLNEPAESSPAPSDGEIFLRTYKALWCIAAKK